MQFIEIGGLHHTICGLGQAFYLPSIIKETDGGTVLLSGRAKQTGREPHPSDTLTGKINIVDNIKNLLDIRRCI